MGEWAWLLAGQPERTPSWVLSSRSQAAPLQADETRDEGRPQSTLVLTNRTDPKLCEQLWTRAKGEGAVAPRPLAAPTKELRPPKDSVPESSPSLLLLSLHVVFLSCIYLSV